MLLPYLLVPPSLRTEESAQNTPLAALAISPPERPPPPSLGHLEPVADSHQSAQLTVERQGQYAGAASRLAAIGTDALASWAIYVTAGALVTFAVELFTTHTFNLTKHTVGAVATLVIWEFIYFSYQWAISGRTIGMAILGIGSRVPAERQSVDGQHASERSYFR